MAERQTNYYTWTVSREEDQHILCRATQMSELLNENPNRDPSAHLKELPCAPSSSTELNYIVPTSPITVENPLETNMDWDINEFFDIKNAALESPTHDSTTAEPLHHDSPALDVSAQPADNGLITSLKRPRLASEPEGQLDAFLAQNVATTNINGQAAVQPQLYQSGNHSGSRISASRIRPAPAPSFSSSVIPGTLATSRFHDTEFMHSGFQCFDWKGQEEKQPDRRPVKKLRKEMSKQQREEAKEVREKGACLRCYVLKLKCSSGYPCNTCRSLFERTHSSRTLQWRACIESSLADINIFTYGFTLSGRAGFIPESQRPGAKVSFGVVDPSLYNAILRLLNYESNPSLLSFLDSLYLDVLRAQSHLHGPETDTKHTFILEDRNPLHLLLHLNTIIFGSHLLGEKVTGYKEYLRRLRAISGSLAFERLDNCLERTTLANSSVTRLLTLIVYISVLLEQVLEAGEHGAPSRYIPGGETYKTMQDHLIEYLSYYLRKLSTKAFDTGTPFLTLIEKAPANSMHSASFWEKLSEATGLSALQRLLKAHQLSTLSHTPSDGESSESSVTEADLDISTREESPGHFSQATVEAEDLASTEPLRKQKVHAWLMSM